jgi:hypothetical protein
MRVPPAEATLPKAARLGRREMTVVLTRGVAAKALAAIWMDASNVSSLHALVSEPWVMRTTTV